MTFRVKNLSEDLLAVAKNFLQIRFDQILVNESAARRGVLDAIANEGAVVVIREGVFVHPKRIRSFCLAVDKTAGRLQTVISLCQRNGMPRSRNR